MSVETGIALGAGAVSCFAFGTACVQLYASAFQTKKRAARKRRPVAHDAAAVDPAEVGAAGGMSHKDDCVDVMNAKGMMAGWEGFSMEEARRQADLGHEKAKALTPKEVLAEMQRGNVRFWTGHGSRHEKTAFERRALITKQWPTIAVLGCSDSRVPIEIVFDQGLGDIFVIRVAGNCLDTATTASLQYAINHLGVKVVMVMGHEGCGAVKAATQEVEAIDTQPRALSTVLKSMKGGLDQYRFQNMQDKRAADREAVVTNVRRQVESLTEDAGIMGRVNKGEILLVGAFYELSSGIVDYPFEVSAEDPAFSHRKSKSTKQSGSFARLTSLSAIQGVQFQLH